MVYPALPQLGSRAGGCGVAGIRRDRSHPYFCSRSHPSLLALTRYHERKQLSVDGVVLKFQFNEAMCKGASDILRGEQAAFARLKSLRC